MPHEEGDECAVKMRLADYVASFLVEHQVTDVFSVVGGGAMHLNDALGHCEGLHVTYNHHEQACAIAAEAYARLENRIAAVCVTTGPGGTNALTGVVGGWLDSIPMLILSGQVRYDTTARYAFKEAGAKVRAMGDQEYDIVRSVEPMTKYAVMIEDPRQIRYALEKAWHLAVTGRPGPVWIDIPVNFQGGLIETDTLPAYDPAQDDALLPPSVDEETVKFVLDRIRCFSVCSRKAWNSCGHLLERGGSDRKRSSAVLRSGREHGRPGGKLGDPECGSDSGCRHPHFHPPGGVQLENLGESRRSDHGGY